VDPNNILQREHLLEILESGHMRELFKKSFLPIYKKQREALLTNPKLDDSTRQAYIKYGECLKATIRQLYVDAGIDTPKWFIEEFDL